LALVILQTIESKNDMRLFLCLIIFSAIYPAHSQDRKYFDAPFGGGGGYTPAWYIPNVDQINEKVKAFGLSELTTNGFYTSGGAGFIYIGFIPYLRIGGMGYSGSTSESITQSGINNEVIYSIGGGGLTVEYTLPFIKNWGVSVGAIIGSGYFEIEIYQNRSSYNWDDVWTTSGGLMIMDISRTIKNSFWILSPTLNIDIPVYRFVSFRIGGGYQISLSNSWTLDNDRDLSGIPSDLNGNSFFIQSGIFIGFFSY